MATKHPYTVCLSPIIFEKSYVDSLNSTPLPRCALETSR